MHWSIWGLHLAIGLMSCCFVLNVDFAIPHIFLDNFSCVWEVVVSRDLFCSFFSSQMSMEWRVMVHADDLASYVLWHVDEIV